MISKHKILGIANRVGEFQVDRYKWSMIDTNNACKQMKKKGYLKLEGVRGRVFAYTITELGKKALLEKRFIPNQDRGGDV